MLKKGVIKNLFGMLVTVIGNVINHVTFKNIEIIKTVSSEEK